MNKVVLMGRLTADPEMKTTPTNKQACRFTLAVNRRFAKDGQQADFISCLAWEKTAEFICKWFSKGRMIVVDGHIQTRSWDGPDGKKQYATEVVVENAEFTGEKRENGTEPIQSSTGLQHYDSPYKQRQQSFDENGFAELDFMEGASEEDLPF